VPAGAKYGSVTMAVRYHGAIGGRPRERAACRSPAAERGVPIAHAPLQRWGVPSSLTLAEVGYWRQRPVWGRCRLDEGALAQP